MRIFLLVFAVPGILLGPHSASATEVKVSAKALERTLKAQLFHGPSGRYYLRGDAKSACFVYAEDPHVSFAAERVVVRVVEGQSLVVDLDTNISVN